MTTVSVPTASSAWSTFAPSVSGYNPVTVQIPTAIAPWTTFAPFISTTEDTSIDKVAIPPANVPLAYVVIGGRRYPVYMDPTWYKYENNLYQRTGGATDLIAAATNSVTEAISVASTASQQVNALQTSVSTLSAAVEEQGEQIIILDGRVSEIEP